MQHQSLPAALQGTVEQSLKTRCIQPYMLLYRHQVGDPRCVDQRLKPGGTLAEGAGPVRQIKQHETDIAPFVRRRLVAVDQPGYFTVTAIAAQSSPSSGTSGQPRVTSVGGLMG